MKALKVVAAYLLWLVDALFSVWLVFICRNTWLTIFSQYYIYGSPTRANRAGLFDRILSIALGFLWFGLIIFLEPYFRNGVAKGELIRRFAKATGPIILAIFGVDFILTLILGVAVVGWLRLVIILIELVLGIVLVRFGSLKKVFLRGVEQVKHLD